MESELFFSSAFRMFPAILFRPALRLVVGTDVQHMAVARCLIIFYVLVVTLLVSFTGR